MNAAPRAAATKVVDLATLRRHLDALPPATQVVLTNGCFDWLHAGHLKHPIRRR